MFFERCCQYRSSVKRTRFGGGFVSEMVNLYLNKDMSEHLDIGESTLRKWCIELEKNGYSFYKGLKESRAFTEDDLQALLYFKQLARVKNHTNEQAAKAVVKRFLDKGGNEVSNHVQEENARSIENIENMLRSLLELVEERDRKQNEFNNALLNRFDSFMKQIKESNEKKK